MKKDRIKDRRKELKLTQSDVGRSVGVSKATVSQWESGDTSPSGSNLMRLAKALKINAEWIETGKISKPPTLEYDAESPIAAQYPSLELLDRDNIACKLKNEPYVVDKLISSIPLPEGSYSDLVFAMTEDMIGLSPLINIGDRVFVKPKLPLTNEFFSMFLVDETPMVGMVTISPKGIFLKFISNDPEWEAVKVTKDDYIGRVIAITPIWSIEQSEQNKQ